MQSQVFGKSESNINHLKRFQTIEWYLARVLGGWLPGITHWETKHEIAQHLWEDMRHSQDIRTRLWELRVTNPDRDMSTDIQEAIHLIAQAQYDFEFLAGIYRVVIPELIKAYKTYIDNTYDVYDSPTIIILKKIVLEKQAQIQWMDETINHFVDTGEKNRQAERWTRYVQDVLSAIGGMTGNQEIQPGLPISPPGYEILLPFTEAKRDNRFEVKIAGEAEPNQRDLVAWTIWQFVNYAAEMQAAETLASMMWEVDDMRWEFYYDIARHCWDEARHSQLGTLRLKELGYHVADFPQSIGSYAWRQLIDPLRRYCALTYIIEAGSFPFKHRSYEKHLQNNDLESAQAVMYDIIDETMHVRWGHK